VDERQIGIENLRNLVVEAVNAGDLDLLREAAVPALPAGFVDRLAGVAGRWPRLMLTAGDLAGTPVAAVWLPDRQERYRPVGHVEFTIEADRPSVAVVDGVDPDLIAEEPPGLRVAEWESARAADRGEGPWV